MCVLDFERVDTDKGTRLTLIDASFQNIRAKFERLDELRRKQFVLHLMVWDPKKKKGSGPKARFRAGGDYDFKKIHSVRFFADIAQGTLQSIDPANDKRVQEVPAFEGNKRRSLSEESSGTVDDESNSAVNDGEAASNLSEYDESL
ncbi:hypothetical protein PC123_g18382 [Phytophthora cactorum]|nr:hypothetical protein PC123_g18382 [Phytophthora cactorum]